MVAYNHVLDTLLGDFDECSRELLLNTLAAGTGVSLSYNPGTKVLTISATGGGGGGAAWGDVTGTLSAQTDLQAALDAKAVVSHTHTTGDVTGLSEAIDDRVGALLVAGTNITLNYNDTNGTLTISASAGGGSDSWTYVKLASDFSTGSATAVDVTGMSFTPAADTTYEVYGELLVQTATATVGPRPGMVWPTGQVDGAGNIQCTSSASAIVQANGPSGIALLGPVGGLPSVGNSYPAYIRSTFRTGASPSGTFRLQLASETAATNVTIKAHSWFKYRSI